MQVKETKSTRNTASVGNNDVCAVNFNYSERTINFTIDLFDQQYCQAHADEVQSFISKSLSAANTALSEAHLPILEPAATP